MTQDRQFFRRTLVQGLVAAAVLILFLLATGRIVDYAQPVILAMIFGFVSSVFAIASTYMLVRWIAGWLLGKCWKARYIRISFDVALIGFCLLSVLALSPNRRVVGFLPDFMHERLVSGNRLLALQGFVWSQALTDAELKLECLARLSWFLAHFPLYVILPNGLVLLAGYSLEQVQKVKKLAGE